MSLQLFDAFGIELEYMLVDRQTLDVRPVADSLLAMLNGGQISSDFEDGPIAWSNELAMHVVELKANQPTENLSSVANRFQQAVANLAPSLSRLQATLLPTAMHPWMNPSRETMLWPHDCHEIYQAFDQLFNCRRHGWSNVQSVHLNLPFAGDEQFARLHAAVRLILPILPALSASSPVVDGKLTALRDSRLAHYVEHCAKVPALMGNVIPEPAYSELEYNQTIFQPIAAEIDSFNQDGIFNVYFLNARGAIARFDRGSIEIRVMDVQEHPAADVAICAAVISVARELVNETCSSFSVQKAASTEMLRSIFDHHIADAEETILQDADYLKRLGVNVASIRSGDLWKLLLERSSLQDSLSQPLAAALRVIVDHGSLATRIRQAIQSSAAKQPIVEIYRRLAACLQHGESFRP